MNDQAAYGDFGPRFVNKVALVTGAGQGIGQATAFRLAGEGAAVGVLDWKQETAAATVETIREKGGRALELIADITDSNAIAEAAARLRDEFGAIHVLVNNAGYDRPGGFLKIGVDDFKAVLDVHLVGTVNCCRACGPVMIEQRSGSIVNLSSIYGRVGSKGESAYCTVKAGLIGLTKALAKEWGSKGVRVNAVLPGLTDTPTIRALMAPQYQELFHAETPLGRSADPSEIAAAIAFLASDDASFVTGATLDVTGGWGM